MKYGIIAKPSTSGNPISNAVLERIHQVLVNLVCTCNITHHYVDKYDPCTGILDTSESSILSTTNRLKCYSPGKLIFVHDMILPIKHMVDWRLIRQQNPAQINKDNI